MPAALLPFAAATLLPFFFLLYKKIFSARRYPYQTRPLLTKREHHFYRLLRREADRYGLIICPKVGLKDLMTVCGTRKYMRYFRLIAQKHVDFVICDDDLRVLFAIELDDSSHDTKDARRRDRFKNRAFRAARIPLIRVREYDSRTVHALIQDSIRTLQL